MENFTSDVMWKAVATLLKNALSSNRPLQLVSTQDIGAIASLALEVCFNTYVINSYVIVQNPTQYAGKAISLAGDELTFEQMNTLFKNILGKPIPTTYGFVGSLMLKMLKDLRLMYVLHRSVIQSLVR